ncbi:MAG: SDR family oxidoreductase [Pseudomonadota bacterium]
MSAGVEDDRRFLILGCGYSGRAFARLMRPFTVVGTTRSSENAGRLSAMGVQPLVSDGSATAELAAAVQAATHIVVSAAPGPTGDPFIAAVREALLNARAVEWLGYLSTIAVYGDHGGALIDETALCLAEADRGVRRVEAEDAWYRLGAELGVPTGIFRLAGIYGPGRNQFVSLHKGVAKRIVKPGQVFNRIHVDDIAATLRSAIAAPRARFYNVADDEPVPPQDVVSFAADLMGVEPPPAVPFEEAEMSPMARSFYGDVKRVSNARIREELGLRLAYPNYRESLTRMWREDTWRAEPSS